MLSPDGDERHETSHEAMGAAHQGHTSAGNQTNALAFLENAVLVQPELNDRGEPKSVTTNMHVATLIAEGARRAEGMPLRPIPSRRLLARLQSMSEESNPDGLSHEWPSWITSPTEDDLEPETDQITERVIDDAFKGFRHQLAIRGTLPGQGNAAERKDTGKLPDLPNKKVPKPKIDLQKDNRGGQGASVQMSGGPLGFTDSVRQRIVELDQAELARKATTIDAAVNRFSFDLASRTVSHADRAEDFDFDAAATLPQDQVPADKRTLLLDDRLGYENNSSFTDFLEGYPELQRVRELLVLGTYHWIAENGHTGIRQEQLRNEVLRGINTVLFGLLVDPEQLRREEEQDLKLIAATAELRAFRQAAGQLGKAGLYDRLSDDTILAIATGTIAELKAEQIEDEEAPGGTLHFIPKGLYAGGLDMAKVQKFSHPGVNKPGVKTTSGFRNLAGRGLRLARIHLKNSRHKQDYRYKELPKALLAFENSMARIQGSRADTNDFSRSCLQANAIGGVATFYALHSCFGMRTASSNTGSKRMHDGDGWQAAA